MAKTRQKITLSSGEGMDDEVVKKKQTSCKVKQTCRTMEEFQYRGKRNKLEASWGSGDSVFS